MIQNVGYVKFVSDITYRTENQGKARQSVLIGCGNQPGSPWRYRRTAAGAIIVGMPTAAPAAVTLLLLPMMMIIIVTTAGPRGQTEAKSIYSAAGGLMRSM